MALWAALLISCFGPVLVLGGLIALINWIQDRVSIDPLEEHQKNITGMYTKQYGPLGFFGVSKRTERESKATPHYDALVEAEWKATKRLEEAPFEEENDEPQQLTDLLKRDKSNK